MPKPSGPVRETRIQCGDAEARVGARLRPSRVRRVTWVLPAPGPLIQAGEEGVDILHDRQLKSSFNSMRKAISQKVSVGGQPRQYDLES
jgi:hypothetical protein